MRQQIAATRNAAAASLAGGIIAATGWAWTPAEAISLAFVIQNEMYAPNNEEEK